jgi:hypothetical protein
MALIGPFATEAEALAACDSDSSTDIDCPCGIVDAPEAVYLTGWGVGTITMNATELSTNQCVWRGSNTDNPCNTETTWQLSCTSGGTSLSLWCGGVSSTAGIAISPITINSLNPIDIDGGSFTILSGSASICGDCFPDQTHTVSLSVTE